jgi:2-phospho-L-lactate guanylyltransferase
MSLRLVLPLKSLHEGKTRLAAALDAKQRAALIDRLLMHAIAQASEFPGLENTVVVTGCEQAGARAAQCGVGVIDEPTPGLNHALHRARRAVHGAGAAMMLVVPCDLPLLAARDLRCLADAASHDVIALAPDRAKRGTNGICLPCSTAFEFAFGEDSWARHRAATQRLGLRAAEVDRPGLAFDVDTPEDLAELRSLESQALSPAGGR